MAGAAGRELEEETGYRAGRMELVAAGPASAGVTDEELHLFLARDLERVGPGGGDAGESIIVHEVPVREVEDFIRQQREEGKGIDLKIYAGLYFLGREG